MLNRLAPLALALTGMVALVACSEDPAQRTEENYCKTVSEHLNDLNGPVINTQDDIDRVVAAWRNVAATAPLAVQEEWSAMVDNVETASTVDPADAASVQRVADQARRTEPAANKVILYTQNTCGITIGGAGTGP